MIILALVVVTLLYCSLFSLANAGTPPAPPTPTQGPAPAPEAPSGDNSSPPGPVTFEPYTLPLLASDGTVTGNIMGIDFTTVRLLAAGNVTLGNDSFSLIISEDLSQKPDSPTMDIKMGNEGRLPEGMDGAVPLISADVARQSPYGWPVKAGTLTMTFTVPDTLLDGAGTDATYYLVRYDGTGYQLVNAVLAGSGPSATLQASPIDDSGIFTLAMVRPTPTPAKPPMETIVPAALEPVPSVSNTAVNYLALCLVLVNGVAIGCVATLIMRQTFLK